MNKTKIRIFIADRDLNYKLLYPESYSFINPSKLKAKHYYYCEREIIYY